MCARISLILVVVLASLARELPAPACAPAPPSGKAVVNADQTVILLWDAARGVQHFIRQASFKSEADDFGFLVPSPSQPELEESDSAAFAYLQKLTEPDKEQRPRPSGGLSCGCGGKKSAMPAAVKVLDEKRVAGFHATVLETKSTSALVGWLRDHGYAYSQEVADWAEPYVRLGWKITALKVAKDAQNRDKKTVAAAALRMTFKTDRPLFPYREPNTRSAAQALDAKNRLLRIYFVAEAKFAGDFTQAGKTWGGHIAWANPMRDEEHQKLLELLKLSPATEQKAWWLTEFEDAWPYAGAPSDVYFSRAANQDPRRRAPIIEYVSSAWPIDASGFAIVAAIVLPPLLNRVRRRSRHQGPS